MYKRLFDFLSRFFDQATLFKIGFNWSPMYRRSTGRVVAATKDMMHVTVQIPLSWRNVNYVGSIFGGSMLSATDPIMMIQLIRILGEDYVVWDKSVNMRFKQPARERIYVDFIFSPDEIEHIQTAVQRDGELNLDKTLQLRGKEGQVFAECTKTMYIATKEHYKAKKARRKANG